MMNSLKNAIDDYLKSQNKGIQNALAFHLFNAFDELIDKTHVDHLYQVLPK